MLNKICKGLSNIILVVLVILAGLLLVPRLFGMQTLAVLTGSMEPNYRVGSLIYIKDVEPEELKAGEVITYSLASGTYVTHRIEEVLPDESAVITKGDANATNDGAPIPYTSIVGKCVFMIPLLGYIAIYAKTGTGIIIICSMLILIITLTFLPEIFSKEELPAKKEKLQKQM